jgi:1,2-diacylglycerol 3-beta-galactosyltransferase
VPGRAEVLLFILDAGGGHRAAARALVAAAESRRVPWRAEVTNLQDVLAPVDFGRRLTGQPSEQTYNDLVRRGRTRFLVPMLRGLQWGIRRLEGRLSTLVAAHLRERQPSVVVSLIPNFNGVLLRAAREALPGVPRVVLLTDLADFPPHFWLEPDVDHVLVSTEDAARQARELGIAPQRIQRLSGLPLHPRFYETHPAEARHRIRAEMGIPADAFVVLLLFGGKGAPEIEPLCERLLVEHPTWHVVAICGENPRLTAALLPIQARSGGRLHPLGFTNRIPELLSAADLLLSKPGPGTLAEALHFGVPLVVPCNGHTIPQERYNARFLQEHRLGIVVPHWREMPRAAAGLARERPALEALRAATTAQPVNRGVFEAVEAIDELVRPAFRAAGLA